MRYRSIAKWANPGVSVNLLYFAQILDELLFDFSLDTYKPSAMNSSLLCNEALDTHHEIEEGNIKRPNFQHVLDELCLNLEKDRVAASLLQVDLATIVPTLKDPKADFHDKRIVVELIARQLSLFKYEDVNRQLLIDVVQDVNAHKSAIRALTRSYVTCLVNLGHASKHIEEKALQFFYYGPGSISGNSDIEAFLELFPSAPKEFVVVYRGQTKLNNLKESFKNRGIQLYDRAADIGFDVSGKDFSLGHNQVYVVVTKVEAVDVVGAQVVAGNQIELLNTLFSLFHHKEGLDPLGKCLVSAIKIIDGLKITLVDGQGCIRVPCILVFRDFYS